MRLLVFLLLFTSGFCTSQELKELRVNYPKANLDSALTSSLYKQLSNVSKDDNSTIIAYKGAVATLKAKYTKGIKDKKSFFKEGVELLEYAISKNPENIEIRCLRLGVQENSPKILGYKSAIKKDKQFLIKQYSATTDADIRNFVKGYVLLSKGFTVAEKQLF